jgi:hypothetical protein
MNKVSAISYHKLETYEGYCAYARIDINELPLAVACGERLIELPGSLHDLRAL